MKTKVVNHIADNATYQLQGALNEALSLQSSALCPALGVKQSGVGLDLAVLIEKLEAAKKLIALLK